MCDGAPACVQVLDVGGQAIPGLYAAGEVAGGVHGADRLGGCATTECLTFGRIAGENVMRGHEALQPH